MGFSAAAYALLKKAASKITTSTQTALNGLLYGNGSTVGVKALDTAALTDDNDHVPTSGIVKSALDTANTQYGFSNTYSEAVVDTRYMWDAADAPDWSPEASTGGFLMMHSRVGINGIQIAVMDTGYIYVRRRVYSQWGAWYKIAYAT